MHWGCEYWRLMSVEEIILFHSNSSAFCQARTRTQILPLYFELSLWACFFDDVISDATYRYIKLFTNNNWIAYQPHGHTQWALRLATGLAFVNSNHHIIFNGFYRFFIRLFASREADLFIVASGKSDHTKAIPVIAKPAKKPPSNPIYKKIDFFQLHWHIHTKGIQFVW